MLAIAGLSSSDLQRVRAAYVAMDMTTWAVIVPLCFASLLTGLVVSLGTTWGLVRHYWVLIKLLITVAATVILMVHTVPVSRIADIAVAVDLTSGDLFGARVQLIVASGAAVLALLATTALSIYKPRGLTRHGWGRQYELRADEAPQS